MNDSMSHFYKLTILKLKTSLKFKNHVLEFISYDWVNLWISHQGQFKANKKNTKNHLDLLCCLEVFSVICFIKAKWS